MDAQRLCVYGFFTILYHHVMSSVFVLSGSAGENVSRHEVNSALIASRYIFLFAFRLKESLLEVTIREIVF